MYALFAPQSNACLRRPYYCCQRNYSKSNEPSRQSVAYVMLSVFDKR